jgi:hypothetical protein
MKTITSREDWLNAATGALRPQFEAAGYPIPEKVRVSCGFTSKGARSNRIGECWPSQRSKDSTFEMFITPKLDDTKEVLAVLVHELSHAAVGLEAKHGPVFRKCVTRLHLTGKMKSTVPAETFDASILAPVLTKLGGTQYPHAALTSGVSSAGPKQTTRMLKCVCSECGYTARTTAKWLEERGTPICPCNELPMEAQ